MSACCVRCGVKLGATRYVTFVTGEKEPCCSVECRDEFKEAWVNGHPAPVQKPESPFPAYLLELMRKEMEANNFGPMFSGNLEAYPWKNIYAEFHYTPEPGPLDPLEAPDCETRILNHRPEDTLGFVSGGREWVERILKEAVG